MKPCLPLAQHSNKAGFSLIVTVTMMILLSLIAVGLLSLSSTVLRSSGTARAQLEARANARLALNLAIGQLQKAAGPDQRVTAPANILAQNINSSSAITGVWESLALLPQGGQNLTTSKTRSQSSNDPDGEFVTWLNSDSYGNQPSVSRVSDIAAEQIVTLLEIPDNNDNSDVTATVLSTNGGTGGIAWATIDESVKARFDLPKTTVAGIENVSIENIQRDRIRNPERSGVEHIEGVGKAFTEDESAKIASYETGALSLGGSPKDFLSHFHDITPWSLGVLSNTVDGGLKRDLTTAFESNSDPTADLFLYSQSKTALAPGEPYLSTLRGYYQLYQDYSDPKTEMEVSIPEDYEPFEVDRRTRDSIPVPVPVDGVVVSPIVSRINLVFSLIGREAHGHWATTIPNKSGDRQRNQMVYLIYTPVVTLYNPYNSPIKVENMTVSFKHLPLGFKFYRNGVAQTSEFGLLSQLHSYYDGDRSFDDEFQATLTGDESQRSQMPVELGPGESRVFGVNHPPGTRWSNMTNYLWRADQAGTSKTLDMTTAPGYNDGNSGFLVDWLIPNSASRTADAYTNVFGTRGNDNINVAITPSVPTNSRGSAMTNFSVSISASVNGSNRPQQIGAYRYTYAEAGDSTAQAEARLQEAFELGEHPELGQISYPYEREKAFSFRELYQPAVTSTPVEQWTGPKQFAVFSLSTRTSHDSLFPTKPGQDTSFVHNVLDMDITEAHPAQMPMELSFLPVLAGSGSTGNVGSIEVVSDSDPRTPYFSGWSFDKGFTNYTSIEVPRTPVTNLVQFRNANLASSGHLPMPGLTVGSSHAHPLLPSDRALGDALGGSSNAFEYQTLDHSWMANNSLFDHFYLSGLRDSSELALFLDGDPVPYNSRSESYLPKGQSNTSAETLYQSSEGWNTTAAFQMLRGPFNVNSTSVEAWKALLLSHTGAEIPLFNPLDLEASTVNSTATAFPRSLDSPSGFIDVDAGFIENQVRWTGFRELDQAQAQTLAESIVQNVRQRGPFTSMSEFLNRQLTTSTDPLALRGALEQAIIDAGVNDQIQPDREITKAEATDIEYAFPEAAEGDTEAAAAAYLSQADLLGVIGNSLTVRGDTFVVRAYGDFKDKSGRILATASCEAVVQRLPDYLAPEKNLAAKPTPTDGTLEDGEYAIENEVNERFGRRFVVRSFRWL
ncbi:MAG: hypothetical protein ACSHYB_15355 [Roseibacillus sp.]